jgi:hypothetical protein
MCKNNTYFNNLTIPYITLYVANQLNNYIARQQHALTTIMTNCVDTTNKNQLSNSSIHTFESNMFNSPYLFINL